MAAHLDSDVKMKPAFEGLFSSDSPPNKAFAPSFMMSDTKDMAIANRSGGPVKLTLDGNPSLCSITTLHPDLLLISLTFAPFFPMIDPTAVRGHSMLIVITSAVDIWSTYATFGDASDLFFSNALSSVGISMYDMVTAESIACRLFSSPTSSDVGSVHFLLFSSDSTIDLPIFEDCMMKCHCDKLHVSSTWEDPVTVRQSISTLIAYLTIQKLFCQISNFHFSCEFSALLFLE